MNLLKDLAFEAAGRMRKAADAIAPADAALVEALLERISEGMQPSDRQSSMSELQSLLSSSLSAVDAFTSMGVPVLCAVLRDDSDDLHLIQGALECLLAAVGGPLSSDTGEPLPAEHTAAAFAILQDAHALQQVLSMLEVEGPVGGNFYVRYWSIQLLSRLVDIAPLPLQSAVIEWPQGVVRLMDLLTDQEALRNEALLLLLRLTLKHEEIQKVTAFEGAFDTLFQIIADEGYAHGGILVQDCTQLLINLLRHNPANQLMFRESGYVANVHRLLSASSPTAIQPAGLPAAAGAVEGALRGGQAGQHGPAPDAAANLAMAVQLVMTLTEPLDASVVGAGQGRGGSSRDRDRAEMAAVCLEANHALLARTPVMGQLLEYAVLPPSPVSPLLRTAALSCLAQMVARRRAAQDAVSGATVTFKGKELPALQAILLASTEADSSAEAAASARFFDAVFVGNADGQQAWASSIPPSVHVGSESNVSFGELLVTCLVKDATVADKGPVGGVAPMCGACTLRSLLHDNVAAQVRAAAVEVLPRPGRHGSYHRCTLPQLVLQRASAWLTARPAGHASHMHVDDARPGAEGGAASGSPSNLSAGDTATGAGERAEALPGRDWVATALLCLLAAWTCRCTEAAAALLHDAGRLTCLLDVLRGRQSRSRAALRGLAAVILGNCVRCAAGSGDGTVGAAGALSMIANHVGMSTYVEALEGVLQCEEFEDGQVVPDLLGDGLSLRDCGMHLAVLTSPVGMLLTHAVPEVKREVMQRYACTSSAGQSESTPDADELRKQVVALQAHNERLQAELSCLREQSTTLAGPAQATGAAADSQEVERLSLEVADRNAQIEAERERCEETVRYVHKLEGDIQSMSELYAQMEQDLMLKEENLNALRVRCTALESADMERGPGGSGGVDFASGGQELIQLQAGMDDLLVCLGQEEVKVEILCKRLEELGVDASALIQHVGAVESEAEGESQPPRSADVADWLSKSAE